MQSGAGIYSLVNFQNTYKFSFSFHKIQMACLIERENYFSLNFLKNILIRSLFRTGPDAPNVSFNDISAFSFVSFSQL